MSPSKSVRSKSGPSHQGTSPELISNSPALTLPNAHTLAPTPQRRVPSQRPVPLRPVPPVGVSPLLSDRQMSDLLRGNRANRVTVKMGNLPVCTVLKPLAKHFSRTWRRELANIHCNSVDVPVPSPIASSNTVATSSGTLPALSTNAPAASPNVSAAPAGDLPALSNDALAVAQRDLSPTSADLEAVKYIIRWMERGGGDPVGNGSPVYPNGNKEKLRELQHLVTALGIDPLIARTTRNLAAIRPEFCTLCKTPGHLRPGCVFCVYCKERDHMVGKCPKLRAKALAREERERVKAERERAKAEREERKERDRARRAENDRRRVQRMIDNGEAAVGPNGVKIL